MTNKGRLDKLQTTQFCGLNLGGWLLMEGYILGGRNIPEHNFKHNFKKLYGRDALGKFEEQFRTNYFTKEDIKTIAGIGFNCVRVPFNYRLIEKTPFKYDKTGLGYLKKLIGWASEFNIKVILDLHAAPGSQNADWHADSTGKALLWDNKSYIKRTYALWEYLVDNLKEESALLGYDLLNEPVMEKFRVKILKNFYRNLIKIIRNIDKRNIVFLEGNLWAQEVDFLSDLIADNVWVSIHVYQPINFTFTFRPAFRYPGLIDEIFWDKKKLRQSLEKYMFFSRRFNVPILVGEFGINYRGGYWGELNWLRDVLDIFKEFNFSWAYWTYKAVANSGYPDGLYQYLENSPAVQRQGPVYGWESYYNLWKKGKRDILHSWQTKNFTANKPLISLIQNYLCPPG